MSAEADRFGRLVGWMKEGGAAVGAVKVVRYSEVNRGLCAAGDIAAGEVVMQIPRGLMLTAQGVESSDIKRQLDAAGVRLDADNSVFAAYLLREKHDPQSPWKPFLDVLPPAYPDAPVLFEDTELSLLNGSLAQRDIALRKRVLADDYATLCRQIPGFDRFSLDQFIWAFCTVTSRLFGVKTGEETTHSMVPLADLCNHRNPPDVHWVYDNEREAFVVRASRDIAAGEAIHTSYGNKCNSRFFLNHGFCLETNADNFAEMDIADADRRHPLAGAAWRFGYPGYNGTRLFRVPPDYSAWSTKQLFSFLRLSCAQGEDVKRLVQAGLDRPEIDVVSPGNETSVLLTLADAAHAALGRFPTSLEEDIALLERGDLSPNARNCILMRSGEKCVLRAYVELANYAIPMLKTGDGAEGTPAGLGGFAEYLQMLRTAGGR